MDGTYVTNHELIVNASTGSLATNVPVMLGVNRDETGVYISEAALPAANTTFTDYIDEAAVSYFGVSAPAGTSVSALLGLTNDDKPFPGLPASLFNNTATPDDILQAAVRLSTNWFFNCNGYAKAYSAAKHGAFKETFFFEFNRTYSPRGYTQPWCDPPATESHPHGNPQEGEYFKCHAGEQVIVFGTMLRAGMPERDGLDVPFMRLVMDYWAAFARWGDPNPRRGWLEARGYEETLRELERVGRWEPVDAGKPTMRLLQWDGKQVRLGEGHEDMCLGLGAGLDSLEA
jgi:carboxylesterase type B